MARPPRPPLYRAARYFSLTATIVTLVILIYVGATVYSATKIRPETGNNSGNGGGSNGGNSSSGGTQFTETLTSAGLVIGVALNFSNPGFLPIAGVHLDAVIYGPDNGSLIAHGTSPNVGIAPGTVGVIPLTITIPLGANSPVLPLLTKNAQLPTEVFANVTLSSLFAVDVAIPTNVSWGAPFGGLSVTPGTPQIGNSTSTVPFTLSFDNNASFADDGQVALVVHATNGCSVTLPTLALDVPAHSNYDQTTSATVPNSCATADWTSVSGTYTSATWSSPLPSEDLP